jgi:hypothetical protein
MQESPVGRCPELPRGALSRLPPTTGSRGCAPGGRGLGRKMPHQTGRLPFAVAAPVQTTRRFQAERCRKNPAEGHALGPPFGELRDFGASRGKTGRTARWGARFCEARLPFPGSRFLSRISSRAVVPSLSFVPSDRANLAIKPPIYDKPRLEVMRRDLCWVAHENPGPGPTGRGLRRSLPGGARRARPGLDLA